MKLLYAILLLTTLTAGAQTNDQPVKLVHYVFDAFTNGSVMLKSGEIYSQSLNYNLVTREMIFDQRGKYLAIANPALVDTVNINGRKFIPVNQAFYEWLGGSAVPLFIEYTCTIKEQGANTGFGNTTTTAASTQKSLVTDGGAYGLKLPDEYQIIPGHSFYIRIDKQYHKVNNEQQISKLFPDKRQVIRDWIKTNKTNFSRKEDVALLVQQLNK